MRLSSPAKVRETEAQSYTGLTFLTGSSKTMSLPGTQGCPVLDPRDHPMLEMEISSCSGCIHSPTIQLRMLL